MYLQVWFCSPSYPEGATSNLPAFAFLPRSWEEAGIGVWWQCVGFLHPATWQALPLPLLWHWSAGVVLPNSFLSLCARALPWHLSQRSAWTCASEQGRVALPTRGFSSSLKVMVNASKYEAKLINRSKAVRRWVFGERRTVTHAALCQRRWRRWVQPKPPVTPSAFLLPFVLRLCVCRGGGVTSG